MRRLSAIPTLVATLALACNGYESPTAPSAPTAVAGRTATEAATRGGVTRRRAIGIPGSAAALSFSLATTSSHTIRRVSLTFDGQEVATAHAPAGAGQVSVRATVIAAPGPHIIRLVVAEQASSPNPYFAIGSVTMPQRILDLAPVQGVVKTGEGLEFRVEL